MIDPTLHWLENEPKDIDPFAISAASRRQNSLTKPPGSLGQLEQIAIAFAGFQGREIPVLENIEVQVFAADHGICEQGVSAFPQEVTGQMIANFAYGGAAISVLSNAANANMKIVNLGTIAKTKDLPNVTDRTIAEGTKDFSEQSAMTIMQMAQALNVGRQQILMLKDKPDLFIGGEMGIGNTSSASAIYSLLLGLDAQITTGAGTGISEKVQNHKTEVIAKAIEKHKDISKSPIDVLQRVGGFEIAALTGAYLTCAQKGIPVMVDGFISTAAALLAEKIMPGAQTWFLFSHQSAEKAHVLALESLSAKPLLSLGMRLGEGSGAAVAISIVKSALLLHSEMATFDSAGVSEN